MHLQHRCGCSTECCTLSLSLSMSCCSHAPVASAKGRQRQCTEGDEEKPGGRRGCSPQTIFHANQKSALPGHLLWAQPASVCRQVQTTPHRLWVYYEYIGIKISERTKFVGGNRSQSATCNPLPPHSAPLLPSGPVSAAVSVYFYIH